MSEKNDILAVRLKKEDGKMIHISKGHEAIYDEFIKNLAEGQEVEYFFQAMKDDGTNLQLAKIHPCIRELANDSGATFAEMKKNIKRETGLCWTNNRGAEYCASFGDLSKEDLGLVIQTIIQIGDFVGINFRGKFPEYQNQTQQDQSPPLQL